MKIGIKYLLLTIPYLITYILFRSKGNDLFNRHVTLSQYISYWSNKVDNYKYELVGMSIFSYSLLFLIILILYKLYCFIF